MASRDVIIIGTGHNGLVAAFYLARAGFRALCVSGFWTPVDSTGVPIPDPTHLIGEAAEAFLK